MSLVVIIRSVTGLILLWRVMLGPDRTFLNAPHGHGWSPGHRLTGQHSLGHRMHHNTLPPIVSDGFICSVLSPSKEEIQDMKNVVWSSLCGVPWSPHSVPLVTIVCFSLQRLGSELWDPRLRVNGPGPALKPGPGRNLVPAAGIESVECCCWEID